MLSNLSLQQKLQFTIPLIPVYIIIFTITFSFTNYYTFQGEFSFFKILSVPIFYLSFAMVLYNHTKSMIVSPGIVDSNYSTYEFDTKNLPNNNSTINSNEMFCKKCNHSRPIRAHHCKICNKCILKMDHHCPWVANCVGFHNQKFFYLFLFYATIGDLVACVCIAPELFNVDSKITNMKSNASLLELYEPIILVISFMMSMAMTISIGFLFVMQTIMISNNLTTIENRKYTNKKDNPFYNPDKIYNLSIVLGLYSKFEWFLPMFTPNRYNNGFSFDKKDEQHENSSLQFQSIGKVDIPI